jgi:predicted acyltransferase (DUF342 family)
MGYKVVVSLYECNEDGNYIQNQSLYDAHSKVCRSIEEAFDRLGLTEQFKIYLACDEEVRKAIFNAQRGIEIPVDKNPPRD